jgi:translation initiation factor 4G
MNNHTAGRIGGDVTRKGETAPELKDCKPLEVNDETRWKSGIIGGEKIDGPDAINQRALVVLNKLTMTNFDKLSNDFLKCGIMGDADLIKGAVELVVTKAQQEPHFSEMYARLCLKMSAETKNFKKVVVERCQTEFETNLEDKLEDKVKEFGENERNYWQTLVKKYYLGHMRFIGELFKVELISIKVMVKILPTLLSECDEEKIECFCKLMSVTGKLLEHQAQYYAQNGKPAHNDALQDCWGVVVQLSRSKGEISSRVKFMLLDLIEMKEKGWQVRRKEEKVRNGTLQR